MFSIIIPMYNNADTIENTLDSLVKQTRKDLIREVLVVDDGGSDESAKKVEAYKEQHKLPIRLIHQENAGPAAARNTGMRLAVADYIAFLDADDEWEKGKLACQAEVLQKHPEIDLLCGGITEGPLRVLIKKHDSLYRTTLKEYCIKSFIFTSTVVIKRERAKEAGYFDETMRYSEDMNYYQRFYRWNQVYYLPKKMTVYGGTKAYYGQSGLSSDFRKMHEGRKHNFEVLRREGQISAAFYMAMVLFGQIKYIRRRMLLWRDRKKARAIAFD